jgi:hypothetical protein
LNTETLSTGSRRRSALLALCLVGAALAGCRQNMHNQHKIEPFEASDFFADGQGARQLPAGVVSRDIYGEKVEPSTGLTVSGPAPVGPPPVTMALLQRGQERFNIFCTPCHDRTGSGRGMIVRLGYKLQPSFQEERLRHARVDYLVTVMRV